MNLMGKDNFTPLYMAVDCGYEGCVRLLLERSEVDVNLMSGGQTPLSNAILEEHEAIVKLLLERSDRCESGKS